jgi:hypothetical protein
MTASRLDRSNYYRGLLVLTRRDHVVDPREREAMLRLGMMLDFDRRFCESAINDLLRNPHITNEPVTFSNRETAICFLRDGIRLALVDSEIDPKELAWLKAVAQANGLTEAWLDLELQHARQNTNTADKAVWPGIEEHLH